MELCQRLTSEDGDDEEEEENEEKKEEKEVKETIGEERETLLHFGASLGICRLVFLSQIKSRFLDYPILEHLNINLTGVLIAALGS